MKEKSTSKKELPNAYIHVKQDTTKQKEAKNKS